VFSSYLIRSANSFVAERHNAAIDASLPRRWVTILQLTKSIFDAYEALRSYAFAQTEASNPLGLASRALDGLRQLLLVFASITGPIFDSVQERMLYAETYGARLQSLLSFVSAHVSETISVAEVNDLREKEAQACAVMFERFFGNFHLDLISQLPSFE